MSTTQNNPYLADPDHAFAVIRSLVSSGMSAEQAAQMAEFINILGVKPKAIERPFTPTEARAVADEEGTITAVVGWDFDALIGADMDVLNDAVSEQITGSMVGLTDIAYEFVGSDREFDGLVCIKVTGDISAWLDEHLAE